MWRRALRSLRTKFKPRYFDFGAFIGPPGQNQPYQTQVLFKIWDLTENLKKCEWSLWCQFCAISESFLMHTFLFAYFLNLFFCILFFSSFLHLFFCICSDLSRSAKIYQDLQRSIKICEDLSRFAKILTDLLRYVIIYQDLSEYVKIWKDMTRSAGIVKICKDSPFVLPLMPQKRNGWWQWRCLSVMRQWASEGVYL